MSSESEGGSSKHEPMISGLTPNFELRTIQVCVLAAVCCLLPPSLQAQPTNGIVTLIQDTLAAAGGEVGSGGQLSVLSSTGQPGGGETGNGVYAVTTGYPTTETLPSSPTFYTQPTNGIVTVIQDTLAPVGAEAGSGNPASLVFSTGQPSGGDVVNGAFAIMAGYPTEPPSWPPGTRTILVTGTIDDPTASVLVNGIPATVSSGTFSATVPLTEGPDTLTAVFTDPAGNSTSHSITVTLNTQPPPRPTVWTPLAVTTASSYPLSGTKTAGTSIWISAIGPGGSATQGGGNGVEVVPLNDATTWSATVTLIEGDNILLIVAKNALGNVSASATANIIVDNLPPVITVVPPAKTNLNPFTLTGMVDDSLTRVEVNGIVATRSVRSFEAAVPLLEGPNTLTITATSPRGYVSTATRSITLGTIPTITSLQPSDGTKRPAGTTITVQITATDKEADPVEFQVLNNGAVLVDWTSSSSNPWTPTEADRGVHTLEVRVRDGFGGYASQQVEVYVAHRQVQPLSP